MSRIEFVKKFIRITLLALMSLIVILLGSKIVTGKDCSGCPYKDSCKDESDCTRF